VAVTQPSVRTVKEFPYRGATRRWSNRYYFTGGVPADSAAWHALFDAITNQENNCLTSECTIVEANGYEAGSEVAVATKSYTLAGDVTAGVAVPGDCAAILRMATSKRSIKNHPVYVFSYFHGVHRGDNKDDVDATLKTAIQNYGNAWHTGITAGGVTAVRSTPDGVEVTGALAEPFIGHRDFIN